MSDETATFEVNLLDGTSGPAGSAAVALDKLKGSIDADSKSIAGMNRALKNLQASTTPSTKHISALQKAIAEKKGAVAQAQASYISLGGTFGKTGAGSKALESRFAGMLKQVQASPGPLGALAAQFGKLQAALGGGKLGLAVIGLGAALTYLVAKTGSAIAELYKYGVAQADARRSELLRFEGLTKMRFLFGAAAGKATDLQAAVDQVSASSALSRDKVAEYAQQLYRMQLRGENLQSALEGVAIKATTQGDAAASSFAGWAAGANMTGQSVRRLTDDVKARLGGVAQAQLLSTTVQAEKQHEAFAALFTGLKTENLLKGQAQVNALLSQGTNSGKALKAILTTLLQPLIDAQARFQPILKRFWQGMIIGALHVGIALLQVRNWFRRTFGSPEVFKGIDKTTLALKAGQVAVYALAAGFGLIAVVVTPIIAVMINAGRMIGAAFALARSEIRAVIAAGTFLYDSMLKLGGSIFELWNNLDWPSLGTSIWKGMVRGLSGGAKFVIDAIKDLGASAWGAFKSKLGIASPSKAFVRLGVALPQGVALGVRQGTPQARRAVVELGESSAPSAPRLAPSEPLREAQSPLRGRGDVTINIGDVHVHSQSDKPREQALDFRRELERVLEGLSFELGARPIGGG